MSRWKSAEELDEITKELEDRQKLFDLYGLSLFCDRAFLSQDFEPSEKWLECIKLSEYGKEHIEKLHQAGQNYNPAHEAFAFFQFFYYRDLFIDFVNTDLDQVLALLDGMANTGQARWPYVFGNLLYHKYNDSNITSKTDHLDPMEVEELLDGTHQGVFQTGYVVSGPFGFLRGLEQRILPPTLHVALWHCSDPGCQARHIARLRLHKSHFQQAADSMLRFFLDSFGPPSEWHKPILRIYRFGKWPNGRPYYDFPAVIGDCFVGDDRRRLLVRALQSPHNAILIQALEKAGLKPSSPESIANNLSPEQQHQLLLLVPDNDLVRFIDDLITRKEIRIPPSELRSKKTYSYGQPRDTESMLCSLGIRSKVHPEVVELAALIWATYESLGIADDLTWRLRGHDGITVRHSVIDFIRFHGPRQSIKDLVLPSRAITTAVAENFNFQILAGEDEDVTIDRLLWKLGFNLARYEDNHQLLRDRLQDFQNCVLQLSPELVESDKANVRSIGVNLFVSVESFLEDLISYNVWLLASDHFTGTRFRFTRSDALKAVVETLGQELVSGEETFMWSIEGTNTFGALLAYLQEYRAWLQDRPNADKTASKRSEKDYPHYADDTVWLFPFKHTALWADLASEALASYTQLIDNICLQLAQADLAPTRNGLDHKREEGTFPESDKMLACASRLQKVIEISDAKRLIPKLFWETRTESDSHGNICHTFADYRGGTVSLWDPPTILPYPQKSFGVPYLIAPMDFLNHPNSTLVFTVTAKSEYSDYWKNYPRRRFIPPAEQDAPQDISIDFGAQQVNPPNFLHRASGPSNNV